MKKSDIVKFLVGMMIGAIILWEIMIQTTVTQAPEVKECAPGTRIVYVLEAAGKGKRFYKLENGSMYVGRSTLTIGQCAE